MSTIHQDMGYKCQFWPQTLCIITVECQELAALVPCGTGMDRIPIDAVDLGTLKKVRHKYVGSMN